MSPHFKSANLAGFNIDPREAPGVFAAFNAEIARLLGAHGWRAFEQPRSAALSHEVGHAIVAHHDGLSVRKLSIDRRSDFPGLDVWTGWCDIAGSRIAIDRDWPPGLVLQQTCKVLAGCVGEHVLDPSGVHEASSLDEVLISQLLANNLSTLPELEHRDPKEIWNACWARTAHVIRQNDDVARELIAKLSKTESVRGTPLAQSLAKVRQVPGASIGDIERALWRGDAPVSA